MLDRRCAGPRHSKIAKSVEGGDEAGLLFIFFVEPYLAVPREAIQQCHHPTTHNEIDDSVYSHEGEIVFWTTLVQVCKIHAHPPFTILLPYHHNIC
jgi:hypothetical protein